MTVLAADSSPSQKTSPATPIAQRVKDQLGRDYPPGALGWVDDLSWAGPTRVPITQIDRMRGDTDWSAAAKDTAKLARFRTRISAGWRKPIVLVRTPGQQRLFAVDGHSRVLASVPLGLPVTAWVGTAKTEHGPWEVTHSRQV